MGTTNRAEREERREKYADPRRRAEQRETGEWKSLAIPEGLKVFKVKREGVYRLDILGYTVGAGNPYADPGITHYERTYRVHAGVGPNNAMYTCPAYLIPAKRCPICEWNAKLRQQPGYDKDLLNLPKERQLFLVIDRDNPDDGVQLWEMAHFNFGKLLDSRIKKATDDDGFHKFFRPRGGMYLRIEISEEVANFGKYLKATAIDFKTRKEDIAADILDSLPCLDEMIRVLPYDELKEIFLQTAGDSDDDDDDKDEHPNVRQLREQEAARRKRADDDDDKPRKRRAADDDDDDEEPARTARRRDDDDDDDPPPRKRKSRDEDDDDLDMPPSDDSDDD